MSALTLLGLAAACCTTLAYVPQVVKTWKTRSTSDISLAMFSLMIVGVILWLIYGVALGDAPLITANVVTLLLSSVILFFKLKYK